MHASECLFIFIILQAGCSKISEKYQDMFHIFLWYKVPSVSTQMLVLNEVQ